MRLSKQVKEEIINAIMKDVPNQPVSIPQFKESVKDAYRKEQRSQLPPEAITLLDNPDTAALIEVNSFYLYDRYMTSERGFSASMVKRLSKCSDAKEEASVIVLYVYGDPRHIKLSPSLVLMIVEYMEAQQRMIDMRKKLDSALAGIQTAKSFIAAFPEFEKYLPKEVTKPAMLPALANVVADLAKMGWPAGGSAAQVA